MFVWFGLDFFNSSGKAFRSYYNLVIFLLNYNNYLFIKSKREYWMLGFSSGNEVEHIQENIVAPVEKTWKQQLV